MRHPGLGSEGGFAGGAYHCSLGTSFGSVGSAMYDGVMIATPYSLKTSSTGKQKYRDHYRQAVNGLPW